MSKHPIPSKRESTLHLGLRLRGGGKNRRKRKQGDEIAEAPTKEAPTTNIAKSAKQKRKLASTEICPGCKGSFCNQRDVRELFNIQQGRGGQGLTFLGLHCNRCIVLIALYRHLHLQNDSAKVERMIEMINRVRDPDEEENQLRHSIPVAKRFVEKENRPSNDVESDVESDAEPQKPIPFKKENDKLGYEKVRRIICSMVDDGVEKPSKKFYKDYPHIKQKYEGISLSSGIANIVRKYKKTKEYANKQNGIMKAEDCVSSDKEEPRLLRSLDYLSQRLNEYDITDTDEGRDFQLANPQCTTIDYILTKYCMGMQFSISTCFEIEIRHVRGLTDYLENCKCGRDCGHFLPLYNHIRLTAPFPSADGQAIQLTQGCLFAMMIEGNKCFLPEHIEPIGIILAMVDKYDTNNKLNNLNVYDLACENNLKSFTTFASDADARGKKEVEEYNKAKNALFDNVQIGSSAPTRYCTTRSREEKKEQSKIRLARHGKTARYNEPERAFMRNIHRIRKDTFNRARGGAPPPSSISNDVLFNCAPDFAFGLMAQRLVQDYFPKGTVIRTWGDVLLLLGEYQIDEGFARALLLFNIPNALSAINTLPLHGTLNNRKSDFVTEEYALIYFKLVNIFNRLHRDEVQTFEQGREFACKYRVLFSKMYHEMFRWQNEERSVIGIDKDRAKVLSQQAGMKELKLPLVDVPWSSLSKQDQDTHRLRLYRAFYEYYAGYNKDGHSAKILGKVIAEMTGEDMKPAASSACVPATSFSTSLEMIDLSNSSDDDEDDKKPAAVSSVSVPTTTSKRQSKSDSTQTKKKQQTIASAFSVRPSWPCGTCTFNNHGHRKTCEMCGGARPS